MTIDVRCACGTAYRVNEEFAGKWTHCKKCAAELHVPGQARARVPAGKPTVTAKATKPARRTSTGDDDDLANLDLNEFGQGRRVRAPVEKRKKETEPESKYFGGPTLEERLAERQAQADEASAARGPWKTLISSILLIVSGVLLYWYIDSREQAGGMIRLPIYLIPVYALLGKTGILVVSAGLGVLGVVYSILGFLGVITVHADKD